MAFAYFDRVKETSSTTGTGSITLAGAVSQFRSFQSVYATNDTMYYTITDQSGTNWEVGLGTLTGATTLARSTVLASSNAGAAVNFTSGSLFVFTTIPAVALAFSPLGTLLFSNTSLPGGNTVANTAAETAFTSSYTIAANTMNQGDVFRIRLYGLYGTLVTPTTLEIKVKFGSMIMLDTGAFTDTGNLTNDGWMIEGYFIVQSIGASGAIEVQGYSQFMTAATVGAAVPLTNTATKTIDTTATQAVTATAQWGSASASNTITLRLMTFEKMTTAAGPVANISNSDGSLTISPTTGSAVASINLANANIFTAAQTATSWAVTGSTAPANGIYLPSANTVGIAANSVDQVIVPTTASAVNLISLTGAVTGAKPTIQVGGGSADTNAGLSIKGRGTTAQGIDFYDGGALQARVFGGSTSVNYFQLAGNSTGNNPSLSAQGEGTVGLQFYTSGTGNIIFQTNNTVNTVLTLKNTKIVQMNGYGSGISHFDGSGNISSSLVATTDLTPGIPPVDTFAATYFGAP